MGDKGVLTKTLAVAGTVLVWLPALTPVVLAVMSYSYDRVFRFDYLMPAELGLFYLGGSAMLLWAAIRSRSRVKWVAWCLALAVLLIVGGQVFAQVTGVASGETPSGPLVTVVLGAIVGYDLAVVATGVGGVLLMKDLFSKDNLAK